MGNEILLMIFFTFFILISLRNTHILIGSNDAAPSNEAANFHFHGLKQLNNYMEETNGAQIEKVSGEDEKAVKETVVIEKFRGLLGLKSSKRKPQAVNGFLSPSLSPSASPSPAIHESEAPSPAPVKKNHSHSHPPLHPLLSTLSPLHKLHQKISNKRRVRRILVAVFVSAGGVILLLLILGLIWFFRKHRKRWVKTTPSAWTTRKGKLNGRSKYVSPQNSVTKKVRFNPNPGMDLFYLNALDANSEQHPSSCLNQYSEDTKKLSNQSPTFSTMYEIEKESGKGDIIRTEADSITCSSPREILSVHESEGEDSSFGDRIIPVDDQSHYSDDESFHSLCDSHSSVRHSFASACSLSETLESSSPKGLENSVILSSRMNDISPPPPATNSPSYPPPPPPASNSTSNAPPTPPPPPPPPRPVHFSAPSFSNKRASKVLSHSTSQNVSSPRNSDSLHERHDREKPQVGVPPTPPPPFLTGSSISPNTPPPPPSMFPHFTPMGKDGAPLPKLKPLHWDKVRAAPNRIMVWDKLRTSSFELDEEMIESLFGYNLNNSMKSDETKSKTPSPTKHVLEPKRLQNITILLKALNVTADQVCDALLKGEGLSLQQLEALVKMAPNKEEEDKLLSYNGNINELGSAENFVKAMLNIPFAFLRIEAMFYRDTFDDEVVHLSKSFAMLEEACKELRSSRLFLKLLEAVLKTGNRMNVGTIRGGAKAFKLDALLKLSDVKGTDGKTTLLHFVVQEMIRSEGIRESETIVGRMNQRRRTIQEREEHYRKKGLDLVSGLTYELCNVKTTAAIDLDVLASSVSNLSEGMAKLKGLVQDLSRDDDSGKFVSTLVSFLNYAEKKLKELEEDEHGVLKHVKEITEYFHGSLSKDEVNPLRIFVIVRDFLGMLDLVCKELRSSKMSSIPNPLAPFRLG